MTPHPRRRLKKPTHGRFLLLSALLLSADVQAAEPLRVDQAVRQAAERPALRATLGAQAAIEAAEGQSAALWTNPEVHYTREQLVSGAHDEGEDLVAISQSIELSGRQGLRQSAAAKRAEAATLEGKAQRRRVVSEARLRFYAVAYHQALHDLAKQWLTHLEGAHALVQARREAGEGSTYDVLRMDREVRQAERALGLADIEREGAWLALVALTGPLEAPEGWPRVEGSLAPKANEVSPAKPSERPELKAWRLRGEAADLEAEAGARGWVPRLELNAGYKGVDAHGGRSHGLAAGIGLSIPLFDHGQGEVARAQAERARAEAMARLLTEDTERARVRALDRAERLIALVKKSRDAIDKGTGALAESAQRAWRAGDLELAELLDVHQGAHQEAQALLALERDARSAYEALRLLTLKELP